MSVACGIFQNRAQQDRETLEAAVQRVMDSQADVETLKQLLHDQEVDCQVRRIVNEDK